MKNNCFNEDLQYSFEPNDNNFLDKFYHKYFPMLDKIEFVKDLNLQKQGIDKILTLKDGKEITIDEKKRRKEYGDILLELWSNLEKRKLGWLYTTKCDYIVYIIIPSNKIYLLPVLLLRKAFIKNKKEWLVSKNIKDADNYYYTTRNLAVKTNELLSAISNEMNCNFKEEGTNEMVQA